MRVRVLAATATLVAVAALFLVAAASPSPASSTAETTPSAVALCDALLDPVMGGALPSSEPLAACQWDMLQIHATTGGSYAVATGRGVRVGVIDDGVDMTHPDIAPNLDVADSCSFIFTTTPTADPQEVANGDCTNKAAVQGLASHGTHVSSIIAAPVNGVGIAGVAPDATIVALKACTIVGYCFADSVAAALRYAGDLRLDIVNLSLFADPYLFYCGNDAAQRATYRDLRDAAKYAQQRGVVIVAAAGNESIDLQHPELDEISPDWPPDAAEIREVGNNCRVAPAEIPGVLAVSATGPFGIAGYSTTGMSVVGVAAPGGDYFQGVDAVQTAILAAASSTDNDPVRGIWPGFDALNGIFPGLTVIDQGARYIELNGTSMASPHAAGVAALVRQMHPGWSPSAVIAAVQRSAQPLSCPAADGFTTAVPCQGASGRTSYFGHGLVDALAAAST
jgi:lantibiotic leader peptide-processing serine protease